jgi:hypothetical protein
LVQNVLWEPEFYVIKNTVILVTGRGDLDFMIRRGSHIFLDTWLTDGGEVVSLTRRPPFTPRKIPGTHFCLGLNRHEDQKAAGKIRSIEICNELLGDGIRDLPSCSIVPEMACMKTNSVLPVLM